jgi:mannose-6-phosphate isomerase-like protein (cupin superfamily)
MSEYDKQMEEVVAAWRPYLDGIEDWQQVVKDIEPKPTGCGPVYELPNPIDRPNESFAIADMRELEIAEPHYHANGETEIYVVLQGLGTIVVGMKEQRIEKGSVIVTPPDTTHYTIPDSDLVLAVVNTPPFKPENYVVVKETDHDFGFDQEQLERLSSE